VRWAAPLLDKLGSSPDYSPVSYHVTLIKSAEGYAVFCPSLPGCCSQGETEQEALQNIQVAIREYLGVVGDDAERPEIREVEVAI
jgi:predicted RNase H-like HicB family nuclease